MYKLLLAILLLAMPTEGLADFTVDDCDTNTVQCQCENSLESDTVDVGDGTASCDGEDACADYATSESASWTLVCDIGGVSEPIASGTIDGPESVAADADTSGCESGTIECYCADGPSVGEISGKTTVDTCQSACTASGGSSITLTCVVEGEITEVYATEVAVAVTAEEKRDPVIPNLNVDLPGLTFENPTITGGYLNTNYLASYINALYRFAIPAMTIVAIVMIMVAGLQYILARGNMGAITKAKARISNAVVGLVILFSAYTLAYLVSPDTVLFASLRIPSIPFEMVPTEFTDADVAALGLPDPPTTGTNGVPYFSQLNYPDVAYGVACGGTTIKSSGCGPTSTAMVLSYYGLSTDPVAVAAAFENDGFRKCGDGTLWGAFTGSSIIKDNGFKGKILAKTDKTIILEHLRNNEPIIISVGKSRFTQIGHFMVLTGIASDGTLLLNDPNSGYQSTTVDEIFGTATTNGIIKAAWYISRI